MLLISAFAAYVVEKKIAKDPSRFGQGAIEGVAAPESANNAGAQTSFIPLLAMGIPPNPVMALMLGAMTIHGIVPGPKVMTERPDLFWGMIASMWLGNLMLIVINLPLIGIWVKFLQIPYRWLYSVILVFCCIGVFTVNNTTTDVLVMGVFGLFGYLLIKIKCEPAPLILGFILGPMLEENFRRSLIVSRGSWWVFLERPICAGFLGAEPCVPAARPAAVHSQRTRRGVQGRLSVNAAGNSGSALTHDRREPAGSTTVHRHWP